jgi:hypothetical protein
MGLRYRIVAVLLSTLIIAAASVMFCLRSQRPLAARAADGEWVPIGP